MEKVKKKSEKGKGRGWHAPAAVSLRNYRDSPKSLLVLLNPGIRLFGAKFERRITNALATIFEGDAIGNT